MKNSVQDISMVFEFALNDQSGLRGKIVRRESLGTDKWGKN